MSLNVRLHAMDAETSTVCGDTAATRETAFRRLGAHFSSETEILFHLAADRRGMILEKSTGRLQIAPNWAAGIASTAAERRQFSLNRRSVA